MTSFWSVWISVIVIGSLLGSAWLLIATRKSQTSDSQTEDTMGHAFDGIEEYDNPLPKWWFYLFIGTVIFALVYAVLFPTLGNYQGVFGWSSAGQWEDEVKQAEETYGPIFKKYASMPIEQLAKNEEAMQIGKRLFANNCAVCHGSSARGGIGFPNLTDNDWLYGGEPQTIKQTILNGRNGQMPAKGLNPAMSNEDIENLIQYLLSFSKRNDSAEAAEKGKAMFATACAACHGPDAKGNQAIGAPNLTDNVWLYGGTASKIRQTITYGRAGHMPAQKDRLGEERVHLLAAYIYSLSH